MRPLAMLLAAGGLLASAALTPAPAAAQAPTNDYSGAGGAELLQVDAALGGTPVVDIDLTPASVVVNSTTEERSRADVANLDGAQLDGNIPLGGILSSASQTAPPDNAEPLVATLIPVPADPALSLDISTATAHARWAGDGVCLAAGEPISRSYVETAAATVLEVPDMGTLVTVVNDAGGTTATETQVTTELVDGQAGRALQTRSSTQVTSVILFKGTPAEIQIDIASTPVLTATATGSNGGATADFVAPVVNIVTPEGSSIPSIPLINLVPEDELGAVVQQVAEGLELAVDETLGAAGIVTLDIVMGKDTVVTETAPDGTSVTTSAAAAIIDVSVLSEAAGQPVVDARIAIAPLSASALVPVGGINCDPPRDDDPLRELHKDVSQEKVRPGATFDYTLTVPNRGPCDLTDVVVTDVVTAPAGTTVTADPVADANDNVTLTWNVGDIAVNETKTFTLTVAVPADAPAGFVFHDDLTASGVCDGEEVENEVELDYPIVSNEPSGPCNLAQSNKRASHLQVTPGETFNYFVHVFNSGALPCSDVMITDVLEDRLDFVDCTDDCTTDGRTVTWAGHTIDAGGGATFTVTVQVADDATGVLHNVATITSPDDDGPPTTVEWDGPTITEISVLALPDPPILIPLSLPRTGTEGQLGLVMALGFIGITGLAIRRRLLV